MKNTENFTGKAEVYSKYRPSYPNEFIDYLLSENRLNEDSVLVDIGAGTGILTKQLLEKGLSVKAVEPNGDMRIIAEQSLNQNNRFTSINATAEHTSLNDNSVDLVIAAQAFHWFNKEKFKKECIRILKQDAKVSLVWNSRDSSNQLIIDNEQICKKWCPSFYGFSGGIGEDQDVFKHFYRNGTYEFITFQHDLVFDYEGFLGRNLSASYAPQKTDKAYTSFVSAIRELFEKYSHGGEIVIPNLTRSYLGRV